MANDPSLARAATDRDEPVLPSERRVALLVSGCSSHHERDVNRLLMGRRLRAPPELSTCCHPVRKGHCASLPTTCPLPPDSTVWYACCLTVCPVALFAPS